MLPVRVHVAVSPRPDLVQSEASGQKTFKGVHYLPKTGSMAAVTIRSDDATLDLSDYELVGSRVTTQERYTGIGIFFDHCKNLTVKGGKVHGYRINVLLRGCQNVRIEGLKADDSHATPIRSYSGQPIDSFLNLRNVDDWTNYGAGIWLHNCLKCRLTRCSAHHAMNGAVLVTSNGCAIHNCDFSYNSALGLALWGSSQNRITWNHLDFCNRPWAGGWGGDAAGLVLVSGSDENLVVGNSMTHGGDGFFLADRVQGGWSDSDQKFHFQDGCNRNVVWSNDGSWASANAFEATFSHDNQFGENQASESSYGFWLGYSSHSLLAANHVDQNDHDGVAIEHGQGNRILSNVFDSDQEAAIHLWSDPGAKDTDRPSTDNVVAYNVIENCGTLLDLKGSTRTLVLPSDLATTSSGNGSTASDADTRWTVPASATEALDAKPPRWLGYRDSGGPVGQAWIQAGAYAPIPFVTFGSAQVNGLTYKLWFASPPENLTGPGWITFAPSQNPKYVTATCTRTDGGGSDENAVVRFSLPKQSDPSDVAASAASQMVLRFRTGSWDCKWFKWKELSYEDRQGWLALFNSTPAAVQRIPTLNADYSTASPVPGVLPLDHYALVATRRFTFTPGIYRFNTVSDDGIRLFVDGREMISRWDHHAGREDSAEMPLSAGPHDLRVEYCQEDGAAQLRVDWRKARSAAAASPRPANLKRRLAPKEAY